MCLSSAQSGRATENCLRTDTSCAAKIAALQRTAWHGVVSTSGCAGPVSQPLVTGTYQSVAHLDQVLSMLMCLVVVGLGASLSFGSFFSPSVVD